jgi:lysophospholipase L1-like esterase
MNTRLLITIALILAVATTSLLAQRPALARSEGAYIALGDSVAYGIGSSFPDRRSYPALVREFLEVYLDGRVELINLAVPGETAASFLENGQYQALSETVSILEEGDTRLEVVTVSLGGNEMLARRSAGAVERQQALREFRDSFEETVSRIRAEIGSSPVLVLTTYYDLSEGDAAVESSDAWWVEQFNQVIRESAGRHDATVAELDNTFRDRIQELTHAPYDVHPKNQGYRAIARQVWSAIGFDNEPPVITVLSGETASRRMPTLQAEVTDNVGVASVSARVGSDASMDMLHTGGGHYVALLDFRGQAPGERQIIVTAMDSAGTTSQVEHRLTLNVQ